MISLTLQPNIIYHADCLELMRQLPDKSIPIVITSPPYWNQRYYSHWPTYQEYLADVNLWVKEIARILQPGRHCFWIIPDKLPWPPKDNPSQERLYFPIYSDSERAATRHGLIPKFPIIWDKRGPNLTEQPWSKKMWGSYPYPVTIIHTPFTERICVWRKPGNHGLSQADREDSKITAQQFNDFARDIWSIRIDSGNPHPASFPLEIPTRILILWSCIEDLVLDPFMGSGQTAIAARRLNRNYLGCDRNKDYVRLAHERLAADSQLSLI